METKTIYLVARPSNWSNRSDVEAYYEYLCLKKGVMLPSGWWNTSLEYLRNQCLQMEGNELKLNRRKQLFHSIIG